ncbi:MAG: DNA mismatch repair protein MutS [Bryobacteraceae bacterium]|jgi:hypothetical protein
MAETDPGPRSEYQRRFDRWRAASARLGREHIALGNARLALAILAALITWVALGRRLASPLWLAAPGATFAMLAVLHARVLRSRRCADRAAAFYERGLARLEGNWAGAGSGGERFDDPHHPYAEDLDLFGKGSLFELLSTARLRIGEETLARWLLEPAPLKEVRARHAAIDELRPRLDLREHLALLGEDLRSAIEPALLARWAEQPLVLDSRGLRIAALVLAALAVAGATVWAVLGVPEFFFVVAVVEVVIALRLRSRVRKVIGAVGEPAYGLELLAGVLAWFEREPFQTPRLAGLRERLKVEGVPASHRIHRLNRLMELLASADHVLMRVIGPPLLYREQLAFAIEAWRKKSGPLVRQWLEAVGELEALCSLASYAYEHPADPFPEFASDGPCLEGEGLAHPLLPESRAVRNDVRLSAELQVLVVSGSNMSGKSTLLRTVGVNAVLAMAGAPVRARRLRLAPLAVGASIRTLDSLQGGTSRFYTEITRIHRLMELTKGELPLLFLLDELLQGTNSHDRRIGAEAVARSLAARGAIGLLTTHDLALAHIADVLAPRAANVHFEDHLEDGKITFDYLLRPGVVRKSNALELMRSVGLEV